MLCDTGDWYYTLEIIGYRAEGLALVLERMRSGKSAIEAIEEIAREYLDGVRLGMAVGNGPDTYRKVRKVLDGVKQLKTQNKEGI